MSSSMRDDLASLRIERRPTAAPASYRPDSSPRRRGIGLRLLSFFLWLIPLGLLGGAAAVAYRQYDQIRPKPVVEVGTVQAMSLNQAEQVQEAKGYIRSAYQASIGAKVPGRVKEVRVREGDRVKGPTVDPSGKVTEPGQVLAVLEHDDLLAELDSRQAMLERSRAELAEAENDAQLRRAKYTRRTQLQTRGTVTGEEIDQYLSDWKSSENKVLGLRAAIRMQDALVQEIKVRIQDMYVRAPHSGTVTEKNAEVGETILLGGMSAASGRGSVATLADLDELEVEADINERQLSLVRAADPAAKYPGQPAEIRVDAVADRRYKGRLSRVIPMGDRTRGTVKVRVRIEDPDNRLFPDLTAYVSFLPDAVAANPDSQKIVPFVDRSALLESNGRTAVFVVDRDGVVHSRAVKVVATESASYARVEDGLTAGDRVVLKPAATLKDGQLVKVNDQ